MTDPFSHANLVHADEFPGGDDPFIPPATPDMEQPDPSPKPILGQNATWLSRTMEGGGQQPSFVTADPPPPSPWEEGVERPAVESVPSFTASTVSAPPPTPTAQTASLTANALGASPIFGDNFSVDALPEVMLTSPDPVSNPGQSANALPVEDLPEVFLE